MSRTGDLGHDDSCEAEWIDDFRTGGAYTDCDCIIRLAAEKERLLGEVQRLRKLARSQP